MSICEFFCSSHPPFPSKSLFRSRPGTFCGAKRSVSQSLQSCLSTGIYFFKSWVGASWEGGMTTGQLVGRFVSICWDTCSCFLPIVLVLQSSIAKHAMDTAATRQVSLSETEHPACAGTGCVSIHPHTVCETSVMLAVGVGSSAPPEAPLALQAPDA